MEKKNDRNKNTSQNKLYSDEIKEMERLSEEQEKALRERRQARKHRIKKNVPPGNYLSRYGTFLLFGSFTRISPRRSAVLLLPALQGGLQLFYDFSSLAVAELQAVRTAVLPFSQWKSERMLLQLPVRQRGSFRKSSLYTTVHL